MSLDLYRRPRLVVLPPHASAQEAARAMSEERVGAVLVCEGRALVGLLTDRDLAVDVVGKGLDPRATLLREVMSDEVVTIDVSARVADAARLMRDHACRRLPILEDGLPVGMVTLDDLLLDGEIDPSEVRAIIIAQIEGTYPPPAGGPRDSARAEARLRRARAAADISQGDPEPPHAPYAPPKERFPPFSYRRVG